MQFIIPPQLTQKQRTLLSVYLSDDYRLKRSEWAQIFEVQKESPLLIAAFARQIRPLLRRAGFLETKGLASPTT